MGLLVRNTPAHCAYLLQAVIRDDLLRKVCLFSFVLGASTVGWWQTAFKGIGVILACLLLMINIGSRSWYFLDLSSFKRDRIGGNSIMPFLLSIFTGFSLSFLSSRVSASGGQRSIEHIVLSAVVIAVVMIVSSFERFQKLIIMDDEVSDFCLRYSVHTYALSTQIHEQNNIINLILGSWWTISLLGSLCFAINKRRTRDIPDGEHFLVSASILLMPLKLTTFFIISKLMEHHLLDSEYQAYRDLRSMRSSP